MNAFTSNTKYVRSLLRSETLLKQKAKSLFQKCDFDMNGKIDINEMQVVIEAMHRLLGIAVPSDDELMKELTRFDEDTSGDLDLDQFVSFFKQLLKNSLENTPMVLTPSRREISV